MGMGEKAGLLLRVEGERLSALKTVTLLYFVKMLHKCIHKAASIKL